MLPLRRADSFTCSKPQCLHLYRVLSVQTLRYGGRPGIILLLMKRAQVWSLDKFLVTVSESQSMCVLGKEYRFGVKKLWFSFQHHYLLVE